MQKKQVLILTLRLDESSQQFFNDQRKLYFPPEGNILEAHLSLFHQLPDEPVTIQYLSALQEKTFNLQVTGLLNLGAGVAYRLSSSTLAQLRARLGAHFSGSLIPQDRQPFRPHITVMNKSTPEQAREVLADLSRNFQPFEVQATGLDVWEYLGGPWEHRVTIAFDAGLLQ